jgi:hypothetical protein
MLDKESDEDISLATTGSRLRATVWLDVPMAHRRCSAKTAAQKRLEARLWTRVAPTRADEADDRLRCGATRALARVTATAARHNRYATGVHNLHHRRISLARVETMVQSLAREATAETNRTRMLHERVESAKACSFHVAHAQATQTRGLALRHATTIVRTVAMRAVATGDSAPLLHALRNGRTTLNAAWLLHTVMGGARQAARCFSAWQQLYPRGIASQRHAQMKAAFGRIGHQMDGRANGITWEV